MAIVNYFAPDPVSLYDSQTWNTGDVITAEKLNKIENGLKEQNKCFEYYWTRLFDGELKPTDFVAAENSMVTYEFQDDILTKEGHYCVSIDDEPYYLDAYISDFGELCLGAAVNLKDDGNGFDVDFSKYPFLIMDRNMMVMESAPAENIVVTVHMLSATPSPTNEIVDIIKAIGPLCLNTGSKATTYDEMRQAFKTGRIMYFIRENKYYYVSYFGTKTEPILFTPSSNSFTASIQNDVFTIT